MSDTHNMMGASLAERQGVLFDNQGSDSHSEHECFERLLTKEELARHLGLSKGHINVLMKDEGLPNYKIGRAVRYRIKDVASWLQSRRRP